MATQDLQRAFKTLSDITRVRILTLLSAEELAVHELTEILGMSQSRVSSHLRTLREAGFVSDRRRGTSAFYRFQLPDNAILRECWTLVRRTCRDDPELQRDEGRLQHILEQRAQSNREFFDAVGADWDHLRSIFNDDALRARAINRLVQPSLKVVELGTGTGVLAFELAQLGVQVIAVDHSPKMLEVARSKAVERGLAGVQFEHADAVNLPLADGEVDAAFAHMVLRYLPTPASAIAEMARVTKPGGSVVVIDFVEHNLEWMQLELGVQWGGFREADLVIWFRNAGLEDLQIQQYAGARTAKKVPATFIASGRVASGDG